MEMKIPAPEVTFNEVQTVILGLVCEQRLEVVALKL